MQVMDLALVPIQGSWFVVVATLKQVFEAAAYPRMKDSFQDLVVRSKVASCCRDEDCWNTQNQHCWG